MVPAAVVRLITIPEAPLTAFHVSAGPPAIVPTPPMTTLSAPPPVASDTERNVAELTWCRRLTRRSIESVDAATVVPV